MPTYKDIGIVLNRKASGEADRIYHVYTKKHGKVVLLSKGALKVKSKMSGHMEPGMISDIFIALGRKIDRLAGVKLINSYRLIRNDLAGLSAMNYILDLIDNFNLPLHPDKNVFITLENILNIIEDRIGNNKLTKNDLIKIIIWFQIKNLDLSGLSIDYEKYNIDEKSVNFFKGVRQLENVESFTKLDIVYNELISFYKLLCEVIDHNLSYSLKSRKFIDKILIEKV